MLLQYPLNDARDKQLSNAYLTSLLLQNLSQLASINYDLLTKGLKDDPPPKSET
jgi:hypothetical protein